MRAGATFLLLFISASAVLAQNLPLPVVTNSPVAIFRRLLTMQAVEREQFIAMRPTNSQPLLRAKVREYMALSDADREARLQALELRALLLPLMKLPEAERNAHMALLPPDKRKLVEERLRTWTVLPPDIAKDVLENEAAVRFFLQSQSSNEREAMLSHMSPQQRADLDKDIRRLEAMSPERRELAVRNVERYFALDDTQRKQTLDALSAQERALVTTALGRLSIMPPEQREQAVVGLRKFKSLSPTEQQQFLRTAQRWQSMPEKERQLWRELVARTKLSSPPPMPPSPETLKTRRISTK
jgi:hypothetical protein